MRHRLDEQAGLGTARYDGGAGLAAGEEFLPAIEAETALEFPRRRAVALKAVLGQNGPDFGFEKLISPPAAIELNGTVPAEKASTSTGMKSPRFIQGSLPN